MFKTLGSHIGLPFLSTREDDFLAFKGGKNGVRRLAGRETIPLDDKRYWEQYWLLFDSSSTVFSLLTVQDIRASLQTNPYNTRNLLIAVSNRLLELLLSPCFPSKPKATSSPTHILSRLEADIGPNDETRQALNCLRVLSRVLPVVFDEDSGEEGPEYAQLPEEDPSEHALRSRFAWEVLWKPGSRIHRTMSDRNAQEIEAADEVVSETDESVPDLDPLSLAPSTTGLSNQDQQYSGHELRVDSRAPSLGDKLVSATIDLLFCAGFTLPDNVAIGHPGEKIHYIVWSKGVGSAHSIATSPELERNKIEVLQFLLVLMSSTIYTTPQALSQSVNRPLVFLTHSLERRLVLSLLCSWLNTSLESHGSNASWNIPYNHLVFKGQDDKRILKKLSLAVLLVALDHRTDDFHQVASASTRTSLDSPNQRGTAQLSAERNAFRYFVAKLHRTEDFEIVLGGILAVFAEHTAIKQNILPGSKKPLPYLTEVLMLLWKMLSLNERFRAYTTNWSSLPELTTYLVTCCLDLKDDPAQQGTLRMICYILQDLSAEPSFGEALNRKQHIEIPAKWAVDGTVADFVIVSIYSIATTPGLHSLFPALMIFISNVGPRLQRLGVPSSTRLLQLFKAFSLPQFILSDESHPRLVFYLLEAFNGVLYHQLNNNPNLLYAILRSHQDFQNLATFTLLSGLREIKRRMAVTAGSNGPATRKMPDQYLFDGNMPPEKLDLRMVDRVIDAGVSDEPSDAESVPNSPASIFSARLPKVPIPLFSPGEADDPLASPQINADRQRALPKSEKARGKMRERRGSRSTTDGPLPALAESSSELLQMAARGIGTSRYVPTQEWVSSWQKSLPLDAILLTISELLPKVKDLQSATTPGPSRAVLDYLKSANLSGVLPPPPALTPRRFSRSVASNIWLTSLLWGDIYVSLLSMFSGTSIKLFGIKQATTSRREQAIQNVTHKLMSFMGGNSNESASNTQMSSALSSPRQSMNV